MNFNEKICVCWQEVSDNVKSLPQLVPSSDICNGTCTGRCMWMSESCLVNKLGEKSAMFQMFS